MRSLLVLAVASFALLVSACRTPEQKARVPLRPHTSTWDQRWWGTDMRVQSGQPEMGNVRKPSR